MSFGVKHLLAQKKTIELNEITGKVKDKDNNINLMSDRFMKTEYLNAKRKTIPAAIE